MAFFNVLLSRFFTCGSMLWKVKWSWSLIEGDLSLQRTVSPGAIMTFQNYQLPATSYQLQSTTHQLTNPDGYGLSSKSSPLSSLLPPSFLDPMPNAKSTFHAQPIPSPSQALTSPIPINPLSLPPSPPNPNPQPFNHPIPSLLLPSCAFSNPTHPQTRYLSVPYEPSAFLHPYPMDSAYSCPNAYSPMVFYDEFCTQYRAIIYLNI